MPGLGALPINCVVLLPITSTEPCCHIGCACSIKEQAGGAPEGVVFGVAVGRHEAAAGDG